MGNLQQMGLLAVGLSSWMVLVCAPVASFLVPAVGLSEFYAILPFYFETKSIMYNIQQLAMYIGKPLAIMYFQWTKLVATF